MFYAHPVSETYRHPTLCVSLPWWHVCRVLWNNSVGLDALAQVDRARRRAAAGLYRTATAERASRTCDQEEEVHPFPGPFTPLRVQVRLLQPWTVPSLACTVQRSLCCVTQAP